MANIEHFRYYDLKIIRAPMFLLRGRNDVPDLTMQRCGHNGGALFQFGAIVGLLMLLLGLSPQFSIAAEVKSAPATTRQLARNIGVDEFDKLRTNNTSVVLDVRTPSEFARGHIPGAVNLDWSAKNFTENVAALDKKHAYLVHCASGVRSAKACQKMEKLNFTNLYNLEGGFKAWQEAGKPVEKSPADSEFKKPLSRFQKPE